MGVVDYLENYLEGVLWSEDRLGLEGELKIMGEIIISVIIIFICFRKVRLLRR